MSAPRPSSIFIPFALTLLLFLGNFVSVMASDPSIDNDDLDGLEELLALEEAEEEQKEEVVQGTSSEADILSRAQRIVLELNNENAKKVIEGNEFVLLLGYAPWCRTSAEMMPQFAEAAIALKEMGSSILLVKLDAERHTKAATLLGIQGFPTLLLFVNGSAQLYTGGFSGEDMIIWARKKTGAPVIRLFSIIAAEEFLKKHRMFAIGLFENFEGPDYKEFVKAATAHNEVQFVETSHAEVAAVLFPGIRLKSHFLGLVKSEPERYVTFEDAFEESKILQFLDYNKFPLIAVLTKLNSARIYSSPIKLQVYIFATADEFKNILPLLQDVARKFKSKVMFIYADSADDDLAKPFLTLFGVESEKPVVAAFANSVGLKYLLESDLTPSNLEEFCSGLLHGTLSAYYKSDPIPDTNSTDVIQVVVGRTFDALVLNSSDNVLLEVYTPWCINCEAMTKEIEKLARHFKGLDNLTFARIDASSNEHPKLQIDDYPTLLFYPSGDKVNPKKLPKKSSLEDLTAFINTTMKPEKDEGISTSDQSTKDEL